MFLSDKCVIIYFENMNLGVVRRSVASISMVSHTGNYILHSP